MAMRNVEQTGGLQPQQLQQYLKPAVTAAKGRQGQATAPANEAAAAGGKAPAGDRLELSDQSRRLETLQKTLEAGRRALAAEPDVREDRVAAAKANLAAGVYEREQVRQTVAARLGSVLRKLEDLTG